MTTKTNATTTRYVQATRLAEEVGPLPLENGDRLTRQEFERRYEAMPWLKKAELIEGVVYMGSPVRHQSHGKPHSQIITWLGTYAAATPGVDIADNDTVRLDVDNEPQPDALLRIEPEVGGRSRVVEDDYIEGPPEFIFEVAASSASYDLHDKLHIYRRNGVQEYAVWRIYDQAIDWWELSAGQYVSINPDEHGVIWSKVFPVLCLAVSTLLKGNISEVLATLQEGLKRDEHTVFVARLAGKES